MSFRITADHVGFYRNGVVFQPKIQPAYFPLDDSDVVRLRLPASLKDDLDWSQEKVIAEHIAEHKKEILWELDFQFQAQKLSRLETSVFFTYMRAIEEFVRWSAPFSAQTFGVCLYRGGIEFLSAFDSNGWEELFFEWLDELVNAAYEGHELKTVSLKEGKWAHTQIGQHYYRLFGSEIFADYLHRLISVLPDGLLPFAFFDSRDIRSLYRNNLKNRFLTASTPSHNFDLHPCLVHAQWSHPPGQNYEMSPCQNSDSSSCFGIAYDAQLFSKARFRHLYLGSSDGESLHVKQCEASLAVYLPSDPYCDRKVLAALDRLISRLVDEKTPFRIICEDNLTEEWNELDQLLIVPESISPQGKRKLQGFAAAGGEIIVND